MQPFTDGHPSDIDPSACPPGGERVRARRVGGASVEEAALPAEHLVVGGEMGAELLLVEPGLQHARQPGDALAVGTHDMASSLVLRRFVRLCALALLFPMFSGCVRPVSRTRTIVTGKIEPRHFHFVTVVEQTEEGPGGWRAACIHVRILRSNTGESLDCRFGIEVPIENGDGPVSLSLAQRIAAERTNETARIVFESATPVSPLGLLCEKFKKTLRPLLEASIGGARLMTRCHERTIPVQLGEVVP